MDKQYWSNFYKSGGSVKEPSLFARFVLEYCRNTNGLGLLADLGCGNGRDSIFFFENGMKVIAIDEADYAFDWIGGGEKNLEFIKDDFVKSDKLYKNRFDYMYSRFTIHAITEEQEEELLDNVFNALVDSGLFFIEVRGVQDTLYGKGKNAGRNAYINDGHYRRFIVKEELEEALARRGFQILHSEERSGLAPYKSEDPVVIRIIAQRK